MNLKQLRKDAGVYQYKMAELLGISKQQFINIEKGKGNFGSDRIEKLAKKYGVDPLEIMKAREETIANAKRC